MNFKFLKAAIVGLVLSVNGFANAGLITVNEWHDTSGSVGGLLQSTFDSSVYFAQSKDINFSINNTYEVLNGYHIATANEYRTLWDNNVAANGTPTNVYLHYNRGGWNGYNNNGVQNYYFVFADMFDVNLTNAAVHAGNYEYHASRTDIWNYAPSLMSQPDRFAGLVLIKNTSQSVPEPTTLVIFALGMIGLASRRFKKQS